MWNARSRSARSRCWTRPIAGERQVAGTAFRAALAVLGSVALRADGINDSYRALLEQFGSDTDAARRALPVDHPGRQRTEPRPLCYRVLIQHLLNPPAHSPAPSRPDRRPECILSGSWVLAGTRAAEGDAIGQGKRTRPDTAKRCQTSSYTVGTAGFEPATP